MVLPYGFFYAIFHIYTDNYWQGKEGGTVQEDGGLTVSAEAILKGRAGRSLAHAGTAVTADSIEAFSPGEETLAEAKRLLRELGFTIDHSGVTLTLTGNRKRFEEVFKVRLLTEKNRHTGGLTVHAEGEPLIPEALKGLVEKVVFPEPPEFFL